MKTKCHGCGSMANAWELISCETCGGEFYGEPGITRSAVLALLPSDLGGLTVPEHLQRMAEDAARYRWLRENASEIYAFDGQRAMCWSGDGEELDADVDHLRKP